MRWFIVMVVIGGVLVTSAKAQPGDKPPAAPKEDLIPDPNWEPNPGDRATVTKDDAPAAHNYLGYQRYLVSLKANDQDGLNKMGGVVVKLPKGTAVHILRNFRPEEVRQGGRTMSTEAYLQTLLSAGLEPAPDYSDLPVEVRVLEGPAKGSVRLIPESFLVSMIQRPYPKGYFQVTEPGAGSRRFHEFPALPRGEKGSTPELRVANLYQRGTRAERSGDVGGAIVCYLAIILDFPKAPEAKTASARMDAMGVSRLANGDYIYDPFSREAKRKGLKGVVSPVDPSKRAESLLGIAKNLEKLKKTDAALKAYQDIATKYPDTAAAREAGERAKAMGAKGK